MKCIDYYRSAFLKMIYTNANVFWVIPPRGIWFWLEIIFGLIVYNNLISKIKKSCRTKLEEIFVIKIHGIKHCTYVISDHIHIHIHIWFRNLVFFWNVVQPPRGKSIHISLQLGSPLSCSTDFHSWGVDRGFPIH